MSKQHTYVLGLNTYDHDVSACLLRDGAIAFAIAKERITRDKHASGFYKEVIDYCQQDVALTRRLHEWGAEHGWIRCRDRAHKLRTLYVNWKMDSVVAPPIQGSLF